MIKVLRTLIDDFPGAANQTHYFLHILNLVVKSILKQFDLLKSKKTSDNDDDGSDGSGNNDGRNDESGDIDEIDDQATEELLRLAGDVDIERELIEDSEENDDNVDGWIDEHEEMTEDELRELSADVGPVRLLLTKVRLQINYY